jgi:transcriptional regulator with XRE-family HTH domain
MIKKDRVEKLLGDESLASFSRRSGFSYESIRAFMSNRVASPSAELLDVFAEYLDTNADYLLGRTDDPRSTQQAFKLSELDDDGFHRVPFIPWAKLDCYKPEDYEGLYPVRGFDRNELPYVIATTFDGETINENTLFYQWGIRKGTELVIDIRRETLIDGALGVVIDDDRSYLAYITIDPDNPLYVFVTEFHSDFVLRPSRRMRIDDLRTVGRVVQYSNKF